MNKSSGYKIMSYNHDYIMALNLSIFKIILSLSSSALLVELGEHN
jgi:hypothetical protein